MAQCWGVHCGILGLWRYALQAQPNTTQRPFTSISSLMSCHIRTSHSIASVAPALDFDYLALLLDLVYSQFSTQMSLSGDYPRLPE